MKTAKFLKINADSRIDADFYAESNGGSCSGQILFETEGLPGKVGFMTVSGRMSSHFGPRGTFRKDPEHELSPGR